uniref:Uncharacterized protein n=1 Tax=Bionectria ochroleuca TaxID=29856 RepID=A0A0B7JZ67_BIOOC
MTLFRQLADVIFGLCLSPKLVGGCRLRLLNRWLEIAHAQHLSPFLVEVFAVWPFSEIVQIIQVDRVYQLLAVAKAPLLTSRALGHKPLHLVAAWLANESSWSVEESGHVKLWSDAPIQCLVLLDLPQNTVWLSWLTWVLSFLTELRRRPAKLRVRFVPGSRLSLFPFCRALL